MIVCVASVALFSTKVNHEHSQKPLQLIFYFALAALHVAIHHIPSFPFPCSRTLQSFSLWFTLPHQ